MNVVSFYPISWLTWLISDNFFKKGSILSFSILFTKKMQFCLRIEISEPRNIIRKKPPELSLVLLFIQITLMILLEGSLM